MSTGTVDDALAGYPAAGRPRRLEGHLDGQPVLDDLRQPGGLDDLGQLAGTGAGAPGLVERGEHAWVDGLGRDFCHAVWFELHEDLLATLGIARGSE